MLFENEFRIIAAENMLKSFEGDLTPQILVALRIAEKRLHNQKITYVNNTEWEVL